MLKKKTEVKKRKRTAAQTLITHFYDMYRIEHVIDICCYYYNYICMHIVVY